MALFKKLAALGAAAEAARRYAQKNPDKVRQLTDKAATFADKQTKGKYTSQINQAKSKVGEVAGVPQNGPGQYPAHGGYQAQTQYPAQPIQQPNPSQYTDPSQKPTPFKRDY